MDDVLETCNDGIGGGTGRHFYFGRDPGLGVADTGTACIPEPRGVATVGVEGRANIPGVKTMWGPGAAFFRFFMDDYANTRGVQGGFG